MLRDAVVSAVAQIWSLVCLDLRTSIVLESLELSFPRSESILILFLRVRDPVVPMSNRNSLLYGFICEMTALAGLEILFRLEEKLADPSNILSMLLPSNPL